MALTDEVQSEVPASRLRDLTRDEGDTTPTADTDRIDSAADAAESKFEQWSGRNFDDTIGAHIDWGIDYVIFALKKRKGLLSGDEIRSERDALKEDAQELREQQRVTPGTNSQADVNTDRARDVNRRHFTRPEFWDDYRADSLRSSGRDLDEDNDC